MRLKEGNEGDTRSRGCQTGSRSQQAKHNYNEMVMEFGAKQGRQEQRRLEEEKQKEQRASGTKRRKR